MTNPIALVLALLIAGVVAADLLYFGWDLHIVIGRRLADLIAYLAFWR